MDIIYFYLVAVAAILFAMAVESLLKSISALNIAAASFLTVLAAVVGSFGLRDYYFFIGNEDISYLTLRLSNFSLALVGPAAFAVSLYFPRGERVPGRAKWIAASLLLPAVLGLFSLAGGDILQFGTILEYDRDAKHFFRMSVGYNWAHYAMLSLTGVMSVWAAVNIALKYRSAKLVYQRKQVYYFFLGFAAFSVLMSASAVMRLLIHSAWSALLMGAAFLFLGGFLLYAVIHFRFNHIRKRVLEAGRDIALSLLLALPAVAIVYMFRNTIAQLAPFLFLIVMAPVFVLFSWLNRLLSHLTRRFLGMDNRRRDLTETFLDRIGHSRNVEELAVSSVGSLIDHIHCRNADFLLFERSAESYRVIYSGDRRDYRIPGFDPFFRHLKSDQDCYDQELIHIDPGSSGIRRIAERYFQTWGCTIVVPLFFGGELTALLHIERKFENATFTTADFEVIGKLRKVAILTLSRIILAEKEQDSKMTKRDLQLAANIQNSLFQRRIPEFTHMDVYAYQKPAKWVSGDYFLVEKASDDRLGMLIADVSGKGVSASLIAMMIHSVARTQDYLNVSPSEVVSRINELMTGNLTIRDVTKLMTFATVFCGMIDYSRMTLYYTNAGHQPVVIYDPAGDRFLTLPANAIPAGIFADQAYPADSFLLERGQILVLYSDGITEAINPAEEEYDTVRLNRTIRENAGKSARAIAEAIVGSVEEFAGDREQFDDITLVVVKL
jgi:serine phosphatase RsbU (regulator of sigma subunit)